MSIIQQIDLILETYPTLKYILAFYFIIRLINKPLFAAIGKLVSLTNNVKDNKIYQKVINSKTYKFISFVLDISLSVKLPKDK